jgi:hypothetical protein
VISVAARAATAKLFSGAASSAAAVAGDAKPKFRFNVFHGEQCSPVSFYSAFQGPITSTPVYEKRLF